MKFTIQAIDKISPQTIHRHSFEVSKVQGFRIGQEIRLKDVLSSTQTWEVAEWLAQVYDLEVDSERSLIYDVQENIGERALYVLTVSPEEVTMQEKYFHIGF